MTPGATKALLAVLLAGYLHLAVAGATAVPRKPPIARRPGPEYLAALQQRHKRDETCLLGLTCFGTNWCCGLNCCRVGQTCSETDRGDLLGMCLEADGTIATATASTTRAATATRDAATPAVTDAATPSETSTGGGFSQWPVWTRVVVIVVPIVTVAIVAVAAVACCYFFCKFRSKPKAARAEPPAVVADDDRNDTSPQGCGVVYD